MMTAIDYDLVRRTPDDGWPEDMQAEAQAHYLDRLRAAAAPATDARRRLPEIVPQDEYAADPRRQGLMARLARAVNLDRLMFLAGIAFLCFTLGAQGSAWTRAFAKARADIAMAQTLRGER